MTLAALAQFICTKVNQTEANDLAACKEFLKRRHEMLWHEALWKDALVQYTQVLSPDGYTTASTWLPVKGVLLCAPIIERVLAVRLADRKLNVQRQEYYFRIDYDSFSKSGSATEFVLLPPCVWEWESAQTVYAVNGEADGGAVLVADYLDADGITVVRQTREATAGSFNGVTQATERLDNFIKGSLQADTVLQDNPGAPVWSLTLAAASTNAPKRQRIRLLEIPPQAVTIRVLGKRVCPTFSAENDEPAISGVTNCLLAFAQGDMLQRERQYGKAQAVTQEGLALLDQLKTLEMVQQAHNITIQPAQGYVSEWQFNSGAYSPLTF